MSHTNPLLARIGTGLFLFSVTLSTLLMLSWATVLPKLTRIQLQGKLVPLSEVLPYEQKLRAQIVDAEIARDHIVLPVSDAAYDMLKEEKTCYPSLQEMRATLRETASTFGERVVNTSSITFNAMGDVMLTGDVRNVGPRSMTVLAQFTDALAELPMIAHVTPPAFTRVTDAAIGMHSPFTLSLHLVSSEQCPSAQQ